MFKSLIPLFIAISLLAACDRQSALQEVSDALTIQDNTVPFSPPVSAPDYDLIINKIDQIIQSENFTISNFNQIMVDNTTKAEGYHEKEEKDFELKEGGSKYSMKIEWQQYIINDYIISLYLITNLQSNKISAKLSFNKELCFPIRKLKEHYFKDTKPHTTFLGPGTLLYRKEYPNFKLDMLAIIHTDDPEYLQARKLNDPAIHQECVQSLEFDQDIFTH